MPLILMMMGVDQLDGELAAMREELYAHCRDSGLVDEMKSGLRARLISRLYSRRPEEEDPPREAGSIWERVAVSLFCDYLRSSGLPYTLSVFAPEAGAHRRAAELSREEVLHVLGADAIEGDVVAEVEQGVFVRGHGRRYNSCWVWGRCR